MSTTNPTATFTATAFGLCQSKGKTVEEARAKCERKARKMMRGMKANGPLPQITVRPNAAADAIS